MENKQIIKKFSDNHCLVLENNQISLRENEFTAYQIVLGKSTNELLEFVKDTYLQLARKKQECERLKQPLTEIKEIAEKSYRTPILEKDCIECDGFLAQILQLISEVEDDRQS